MGTGGAETTAERQARLQLRKKELETLLAAKNDELYELCVQEVNLTGVVPPEAPRSPDRVDAAPKRRISHRLSTISTPSISGVSVSSVQRPRHAQTVQTVQTTQTTRVRSVPPRILQNQPEALVGYRTVTSDRMHRFYSETRSMTHLSSSHPDIASQHSHHSQLSQHSHRPQRPTPQGRPPAQDDSVPLIYQYASQLKAHSHHLTGLPTATAPSALRKKTERPRRNTLHRTQTYHLTSHSDYSRRNDGILQSPPSPLSPLTPLSPLSPLSTHSPLSPLSGHRLPPPPPLVPNSPRFSDRPRDPPDQRPKEKEWYESSLDSPSAADAGHDLSRESRASPQRPPGRPPGSPSPRIRRREPYAPHETRDPPQEPFPAHRETFEQQGAFNAQQGAFNTQQGPFNAQYELSNSQQEAFNAQQGPFIAQQGGFNAHQELLNAQQDAYNAQQEAYNAQQEAFNAHQDAFNANRERPSPGATSQMQSPGGQPPSSDVPFESPKNCTVVESGKWIPYREVSKPFEMSDFYKYSTKFRQNNNNIQKQTSITRPGATHHNFPEQERTYSQEHPKYPHHL